MSLSRQRNVVTWLPPTCDLLGLVHRPAEGACPLMLSRCLRCTGKGRGGQQAWRQDKAHQQGVIQHQCQQPAEGACRAGTACVSVGA